MKQRSFVLQTIFKSNLKHNESLNTVIDISPLGSHRLWNNDKTRTSNNGCENIGKPAKRESLKGTETWLSSTPKHDD